MPIRLFIADDHKLFRLGLRNILEQFDGVQVTGEAENGNDLLHQLNSTLADIVLLDINMPGMDGLTALPLIVKNHPRMKVIMLSMHTGDNYIQQSIELGACGYLNKNAEPDEIEEAISSVHVNGFYFNQNTGKQMLQNMVRRSKLTPVFDKLEVTFTEIEMQVMQLVCRELTSQEIADELNSSRRTVEDIKARIMKKTGTRSSVGIVMYATKHNLL